MQAYPFKDTAILDNFLKLIPTGISVMPNMGIPGTGEDTDILIRE
jgi:hypothetical protein